MKTFGWMVLVAAGVLCGFKMRDLSFQPLASLPDVAQVEHPGETAAKQEQEQEQQFVARYTASAEEVKRRYPQAMVAGSPLYEGMKAFDEWLKEAGDPLFHKADKPLIIAKVVAERLDRESKELAEEQAARALQSAQEERERAAASTSMTRYEASAREAQRLYPQAGIPGTAFYNYMARYDQWLKQRNDDLFYDENKPMIMARIVAGWLAQGYPGPWAQQPASPAYAPETPVSDFSLTKSQAERNRENVESLRQLNDMQRTQALDDIRHELHQMNFQNNFNR